jgi:hypothetical protein
MDSAEEIVDQPRVRLDTDGVFHIDFTGCSRITRAAVEFANRRHRELTSGQPAPVLIVGEYVGRVDYLAQRYASAPEVREMVMALALVADSFLQRHLARMFLMYHRPSYPVQVFADEATAHAWLLRQRESAV